MTAMNEERRRDCSGRGAAARHDHSTMLRSRPTLTCFAPPLDRSSVVRASIYGSRVHKGAYGCFSELPTASPADAVRLRPVHVLRLSEDLGCLVCERRPLVALADGFQVPLMNPFNTLWLPISHLVETRSAPRGVRKIPASSRRRPRSRLSSFHPRARAWTAFACTVLTFRRYAHGALVIRSFARSRSPPVVAWVVSCPNAPTDTSCPRQDTVQS
jgi:hypothetical protein